MTRPHLLEGNISGSVANLSSIRQPLKLSGRLSELFWMIMCFVDSNVLLQLKDI